MCKSVLTTGIPVFNGEKYIRAALESLHAQTRPPDRVVVFDNCSTDKTREVVEAFKGLKDLELRTSSRNIGGLPNFNRTLELASQTDYLHILSCDDLIKPDFYSRLTSALDPVLGQAMAFSRLSIIDESGKIVSEEFASKKPSLRVWAIPKFLARQSELRHVYCQSVLLKTVRKPSPVNFETDWLQAADVVFFAEWARLTGLVVEIQEPLCLFRVHSGSFTSGNMFHLDRWVMEEWRAMQRVAALIDEPRIARLLRNLKLKCIFAARSRVKMSVVGHAQTAYAREIAERVRATVGEIPWRLGSAALKLR